MLETPGGSVEAVYFPQSGLISLIVQMPEDSSVEVGTVGSEGAVGMAARRVKSSGVSEARSRFRISKGPLRSSI
jgi:hypothetical protein